MSRYWLKIEKTEINIAAIASKLSAEIYNLKILEKNKIPCAKFATSQNVNEAKSIAKDLGYPVIIKPVDNAGSRGVLFIKNQIDLEKYKESKNSLKEFSIKNSFPVKNIINGPKERIDINCIKFLKRFNFFIRNL